jgi:hypothetical protein
LKSIFSVSNYHDLWKKNGAVENQIEKVWFSIPYRCQRSLSPFVGPAQTSGWGQGAWRRSPENDRRPRSVREVDWSNPETHWNREANKQIEFDTWK